VEILKGKIIKKPWGNENWLADGVRTPYALKKITFLQGHQSSLQVHKYKFETNFVLSGRGKFLLGEEFFDVDKYLASAQKTQQLSDFTFGLKELFIGPGDIIDVKPGFIHRVIALSDLIFIEASTNELDDVIRLMDDTGRGNGRIQSEHES
jgi:mannose-6-phosphate isomerase-like protein (cupin superfamily)